MPPRARDPLTLDLFDWTPPADLVRRYEPEKVRSASLRDRIARAVAETLREAELSREDIAQRMGEWLGEDVTRNMLDAYASQARGEHTIPYLRLLALIHVTGDVRLLQLGAELFDHAVIEDRWLEWVEYGQMAEHKIETDKAVEAKLRTLRSRR